MCMYLYPVTIEGRTVIVLVQGNGPTISPSFFCRDEQQVFKGKVGTGQISFVLLQSNNLCREFLMCASTSSREEPECYGYASDGVIAELP